MARSIPCRLERRGGQCVAGAKCVFTHVPGPGPKRQRHTFVQGPALPPGLQTCEEVEQAAVTPDGDMDALSVTPATGPPATSASADGAAPWVLEVMDDTNCNGKVIVVRRSNGRYCMRATAAAWSRLSSAPLNHTHWLDKQLSRLVVADKRSKGRHHLRPAHCNGRIVTLHYRTYSSRYTTSWNSTLGYPGEGHPINVATFNARGLVTEGRLEALLSEACYKNIHVLMIQEHNFRPKYLRRVERVAKKNDYAPFVACLPSHAVRGGAAVFVSSTHPDIVLDGAQASYTLGARVASVRLSQNGSDVRYTSVYAPVHAPLRRVFFARLRKCRLITADSVMGGDWNCVPNVALDTSCDVDSDPEGYPNTHAPALESLVANKGLSDVHRLVNGNDTTYTRYGDTIFTRLDRLYLRAYNSNHHWTKASTNYTLFRTSWTSDHYA